MGGTRKRGHLGVAVGMALFVVVLGGMPLVAAEPPETYYSFNSSNEGFAKGVNQPWSEVAWDSANGRVSVVSDRQDTADELFTHSTPALGTSTDFTVRSRWATTVQGNWQLAFPIFLAASGNTQVDAANSVYVHYASRDSNLGWAPIYYLRYKDASGVLRINVAYTALANTEYRFFIGYAAVPKVLTIQMRNSADIVLATGRYVIGSNPNDGFTLGKVGIASDGFSSTSEPITQAWTDDIRLFGVVSIYDVLVNRNSLVGTTADFTWATSPSGACDLFEWGTTPSYGNTPISPPCGTHSVSLTGLTKQRTYYYRITSSASGYTSGTYRSSFYPTDVSTSKVYENYPGVQYTMVLGDCGAAGKKLIYNPRVVMAGDVEHDLASQNTQDWTPHIVYTHIDAQGEDWCNIWGGYVYPMEFAIDLYVKDFTTPFVSTDDWLKGLDVRPRENNDLQTGTVSYSINAGGTYNGAGFGASANFGGSVQSYSKWWGYSPGNDGWALVGESVVAWLFFNRQHSLDVTFLLKVNDTAAHPHYLDLLHFRVVFTTWAWQTSCGTCGPPSNTIPEPFSYTIETGDGVGTADQYTELQDGTQELAGFT